MCIRKVVLWIVAISVSSAAVLEAQPGGRRGGMGGGIVPEQIFVLLAIDEKFKVTDKQLPALRQALTPLYVEQQQMLAEMFSGEVDFRAMREKMREQQTKMRDKITTALATALDAEQIEALKAHLQQEHSSSASAVGRGGVETVRRAVGFRILSTQQQHFPRLHLCPDPQAVQVHAAGQCAPCIVAAVPSYPIASCCSDASN